MDNEKEVWLRGERTPGIVSSLQPAVDALLQAAEEIKYLLKDFPNHLLWKKPSGCAPVGFHVCHIAGFLDRLLSYAEGKSLTSKQLDYLQHEAIPSIFNTNELLISFSESIDGAIERLKAFPESALHEMRLVGRAGLPSSVIGLCIHAAEHTMRHTGQLLVTVKVLLDG